MTRPPGKVETFIKELHPIGYLAILVPLLCLSIWLAPGSERGAAMWLVFFVVVGLVLRYLVCWLSHRLEHPWWYKREHAREGTLRFNGGRNRFEIGERKFYSYHQLWKRRGPPLTDPDQGY